MSKQVILTDLFSAISSPVLAAGATPCALPDGPRTDLFGQAVAHANLLAQPVPGGALPTNAISGLSGSISSASAALALSLVSKLKQRLTTDGSILFNLIWKAKATPAGRLVYRLAALGRRTSDKDSGSWPTPTLGAKEWSESAVAAWVAGKRGTHGLDLGAAAVMAGWPSPMALSGGPSKNPNNPRGVNAGNPLETAAHLTSWPTASARDWKDTTGMATTGTNPDGSTRSRLDQLPRVAGLTVIGSPAATEKPGQLNPAHSRWLMGYPAEWDACAPTATPSSRKSRKSS